MVDAARTSPAPPPAPTPRGARITGAIVLATLGAGALLLLFGTARKNAADPARCPDGTVAAAARCCPAGQSVSRGRCEGAAVRCPAGLDNVAGLCIARARRVRLAPGTLRVGPGDWEAQGLVAPRTIEISSEMWLDSHEVTMVRWNQCVAANACAPLARGGEPGLPATGMSFEQARAFCAWSGGALPTEDEWIFAAAGPGARRYPWGDTGAVCRKACWGLAHGPCARGGSGPDLAGVHADDVTPEGVADLAGGVAEWVVRADGSPTTHGGSFRSALATELRTWRAVDRKPDVGWDDVGVRCRYLSP
jgi:formylglycine-generating enzyme required for sulfatase activity